MSKIKKFIPYLIILLVLISYGLYIQHNTEKFQELLHLSAENLVLLSVLILCSIINRGYINYLLYRGIEIPIPFFKSFGLATINTLGNQLPFSGGIIAKGVYLKKRYELSFTTFLSATGSLFLSFIAANGIVGLLTLLYLHIVQNSKLNILLLSGFSVMALSISLQWIRVRHDFLPKKWKHHVNQLIEGWHIFRENLGLLLTLIGLQLISTTLTGARFWISFKILSQDIPFSHCLVFSSATILTQLISVAPGGIGVREGIVAGIAAVMGLEPGLSAVAVGIDRLLATTFIVIFGSIFSYLLSKDALEESTENKSETKHKIDNP